MRDKTFILVSVAIFVFLISIFIYSYFYLSSRMPKRVAEDYVGVFKGEKENVIHSTYVYVDVKNNEKVYRYLVTEMPTSNSDKSKPKEIIVRSGSIKSVKLLFDLAKSTHSYEYVIVRGEDKHYTILEFMDYLTS